MIIHKHLSRILYFHDQFSRTFKYHLILIIYYDQISLVTAILNSCSVQFVLQEKVILNCVFSTYKENHNKMGNFNSNSNKTLLNL